MTKITVIGGFGFNAKPLEFIYSLVNFDGAINFVDINLFPAAFTLNDMSDYVAGMVNENNKDKNYRHPSYVCVDPSQVENNRGCGNDKQRILIAYSMGGLIALDLAFRQPYEFDKIILINSTPKFIANSNWGGIKALDFRRLQKRLEDSSIKDFMKYFTTLVAIPERIRDWNNYFSWWSDVSKEQLQNLLQILAATDFRADMYKLGERLIMVNAVNDVLIKNNNLLVTTHWLKNATHLHVEDAQEIIQQTIKNAMN